MRRAWIGIFLFVSVAFGASPWPEVASDLPPDPALRVGTLPNGLRYLILPNAEPKGHVSLRLLVAAGSVHENGDERGLAHFVEHMAFRGTRDFPGDTLTETLQRLGVGLGPDNTAFTSFDYTIYHLELPSAEPATLHEGLHAFREYASAVTFDPGLIERERGVVLSERGTRDTPQSRAAEANLAFLWPGARETSRAIIGTTEGVRTFNRAQFTAFYDAWYRPERMAVIAVGDFDPAMAERQVVELFSPLTARGPARPEPPSATESDVASPDVAVYADPGLIGLNITLERPQFFPRTDNRHAQRVQELRQALAFRMLESRLERRARAPDASFVGPTATVSSALRNWRLVALGANGKIDDWRKTAADLEQQHRRAFLHGFTAAELAEARATFATAYEQATRSAATRSSSLLAQQLAGVVLYGVPFPTPAILQQDLAPELAAITLEDCHTAFRDAWTAHAPNVYVAANSAFRITREKIAETLNASRATKVSAPVDEALGTFAYTDFGKPGTLVHEERVADLDLRLAEYANGVRFNFKSTAFESDIAEVHVRVGEGQFVQPEAEPGLNLFANALFTAGGLGKHSADDVRRLLAGRAVSVSFSVEPDAFAFSARCARRDLVLCLQLMTAYITDAGYRPEALRDARAALATMYVSLANSPGGAITALAPVAMTGDRRFGVPPAADVMPREIPALRTWLEPYLKRGAIEVSVVGDVSWPEAAEAVAKTLGALPARDRRMSRSAAKDQKPLAAPAKPNVYGLEPGVKQGAIAWYWPMTITNIHDDRRCHLLARGLAERFRHTLREELGASYSLNAAFVDVAGFPHLNYFVVYAETDPGRVAATSEIFAREMQRINLDGLTADEFERIKPPYLREMSDNLRTNIYWGMTVLSDAQENPNRIAAARDRSADVASITREQVNQLARLHLAPAQAFKFATVRPNIISMPAR